MKISDEEVKAAQDAFWATGKDTNDSLIDALKAALRVRKKRKQERRIKAAEHEGEKYGACV